MVSPRPDLARLLDIANGILDEVSDEFLAGMGAPSAVAKHGTDFATEIDLALERRISEMLVERTGLGVHGEEFGGTDVTDGAVWLLDPIDGTFNYSVGLPQSATLLALAVDGIPVIGLTAIPATGHRYAAYDGGPLLIDGQEAPPLTRISLHGVAVGYPSYSTFGGGEFPGEQRARVQHEISNRQARIRTSGCVGSDMALVAGGALAGAISYGRHPWDFAAGAVLVRAAGGIATDVRGRQWDVTTPSLVAAAPGVHEELMEVIADGEWPEPDAIEEAK